MITDGTVKWGYVANGTNANLWMIEFCITAGNGRHGLYVDGEDSNAGVCINLDSSANGAIGIYESSFLGNTYMQCHTSGNLGGSYKADAGVNRSLFLNCYAESGQPATTIDSSSMVLGGTFGSVVTGTALQVVAGQVAGDPLIWKSTPTVLPEPPRPFEFRIGDVSGTGIVFAVNNEDDTAFPTQLRYRGAVDPFTPSTLVWNLGNYAGYDGHGVALKFGAFRPPGAPSRDRGMEAGQIFTTDYGTPERSFGLLNQGVRIAHAAAVPAGGTWMVGDVVFNKAPATGQPMGWMCTVSGTAGSYTEGRTATATGTAVVTLSAASTEAYSGLRVGDRISINGVSTYIKDFNLGRTQLTLANTVPTGVGLPITFVAPTFKAMPSLL